MCYLIFLLLFSSITLASSSSLSLSSSPFFITFSFSFLFYHHLFLSLFLSPSFPLPIFIALCSSSLYHRHFLLFFFLPSAPLPSSSNLPYFRKFFFLRYRSLYTRWSKKKLYNLISRHSDLSLQFEFLFYFFLFFCFISVLGKCLISPLLSQKEENNTRACVQCIVT